MKKSLKNILIVSYSVMALLIIASLSLFFYVRTGQLFEEYAKKQQKTQIDRIISQVNQLIDKETGALDESGIDIIGYAALQNGYIIHVQSADGEIDWDVRTHQSEECYDILKHAEGNMKGKYPNFQGHYTEDTYTLEHEGTVFGTMKAGYYGPYSLSDQELELMGALNQSLLFIGVLALLGVTVLGTLIARAVSRPIDSVILVAQKIADGEYGVQAEAARGMSETEHMVKAVNGMSRALETEERQKKQITADVAHELRTPLTNLQSHMEAMMDGIWEPTSERLESCHGEILRLVRMVGQLQELYSLEKRGWEPDRTSFNLKALCDEIYRDFEISIKDKQIHFITKIQSGETMYADYSRMKQCLVNLVANALTYTPAGGTVAVIYRKTADGRQEITVEDSGIGVPEGDLPYLFERFYRVDKSRSKKTGGMGIGLSITRAITEKHGGRIYAENREDGGARFIMILPDS